MDKEGNYSGNFQGADYSIDHDHHQLMKPRINEETYVDTTNQIVDYTSLTSHTRSSTSPDKLSFADVMQFADFGPRLGLINQTKIPDEGQEEEEEEVETGIDPVYFLRFPVLNEDRYKGLGEEERGGEDGRGNSENNINGTSEGVGIVGGNFEKNLAITDGVSNKNNKRKRARSVKTSEEVESQRMTHIAVERNRRKQMNEHLRVLRSLMPGSYVQRGDQASIIGGAIDFVRELEQLLQCLESQKRRRIYGSDPPPPRPMGDSSTSSLSNIPQQPQPFFNPPSVVPLLPNNGHDNNQLKLVEFDPTAEVLREETAESKSVLADVEVKMLGFDAMIKILSRRRPGQLIKTIAALEDLQLVILHTNITTIEQTVLYSFNVKVTSEARFSAEDIASSVQQIFSFIHANNTI